MAITIEVTAEDIVNGQRSRCYHDPIALAASRALGVRTFTGVLHIHAVDGRSSWLLPRIATKFILDFDVGKPVKPFSFTIE